MSSEFDSFLKNKLSMFSTNLINCDEDVPIKQGLLNITDSKESYLIVVDSITKRSHWKVLTEGKVNTIIVNIEDLVHYSYVRDSLILDLYPGSYTKDTYRNISNIYYETCWAIFENVKDTSIQNISNCFKTICRTIYISKAEIAKFISSLPQIYLFERELDDMVESELIKYYTGIPFNKESGSYSEFIPVFQQNIISELCITPKDKYKILASKYYFYKKRRLEKLANSFIKFRTKESYMELKDFLEEKRLHIISELLKDLPGKVFIQNFKTNEAIDNFCIRNNIARASSGIGVNNYKYKLNKHLLSTEIEDVSDSTDFVILGTLTISILSDLQKLSNKFDCPIIIPYYKNTRDESLIAKAKAIYNNKIITSCEKFTKDRVCS